MILRDIVIEVPDRSTEVPLMFFSDDHRGDVCFAEDILQDDINWVRKHEARWLHLGDKFNATTPDDKRYEHLNLAKEYRHLAPEGVLNAVLEDHTAIYKPIAHLCEGAVIGNHCQTLQRIHHKNLHFEFLQKLIPDGNWRIDGRHYLDLGYRAIVRIKFRRVNSNNEKLHSSVFMIWLWHGFAYPTLRQTRMGNLLRKANDYTGINMFLVGHWHDRLFWQDSSRITVPHRGELKLTASVRYLGMCGTYLKGMMENHDGYADKHAYPACELGGLRLWVNPNTLEVREG